MAEPQLPRYTGTERIITPKDRAGLAGDDVDLSYVCSIEFVQWGPDGWTVWDDAGQYRPPEDYRYLGPPKEEVTLSVDLDRVLADLAMLRRLRPDIAHQAGMAALLSTIELLESILEPGDESEEPRWLRSGEWVRRKSTGKPGQVVRSYASRAVVRWYARSGMAACDPVAVEFDSIEPWAGPEDLRAGDTVWALPGELGGRWLGPFSVVEVQRTYSRAYGRAQAYSTQVTVQEHGHEPFSIAPGKLAR